MILSMLEMNIFLFSKMYSCEINKFIQGLPLERVEYLHGKVKGGNGE